VRARRTLGALATTPPTDPVRTRWRARGSGGENGRVAGRSRVICARARQAYGSDAHASFTRGITRDFARVIPHDIITRTQSRVIWAARVDATLSQCAPLHERQAARKAGAAPSRRQSSAPGTPMCIRPCACAVCLQGRARSKDVDARHAAGHLPASGHLPSIL
jgi:hypothetical protein